MYGEVIEFGDNTWIDVKIKKYFFLAEKYKKEKKYKLMKKYCLFMKELDRNGVQEETTKKLAICYRYLAEYYSYIEKNDSVRIMYYDKSCLLGDFESMIQMCNYFKKNKNMSLMESYFSYTHKNDKEKFKNNNNNSTSLFYIGLYYYIYESDNYEKIKKYFLIAIDNGDLTSNYYLGLCYKKMKDFENMEKHLIIAATENINEAIRELTEYYKTTNNNGDMEKYLIMLIHNNEKQYELIKNYNESIKYDYGIEKYNDDIYELAKYYKKNKCYDDMIKYYIMAINKGHIRSVHELSWYYDSKNIMY